ncbi:MAG: TRAP transporter small permease subunit [Gammaproteobacteria bacterium]|nr:TRAP transporter small permease subunit [Gammaproteobacteria bacterium]
MNRVSQLLRITADAVSAALLAAIFITFSLQIFSRYVMNAPLGWTIELCLILWLWLVFWAGAFCVRDEDQIRFDVLVDSLPTSVGRKLAGVAALFVAGTFAYSFLPTLDYIDFYRIKKTPLLKFRFNHVFSIYGVFLVVVVLRYLWIAKSSLLNRDDSK